MKLKFEMRAYTVRAVVLCRNYKILKLSLGKKQIKCTRIDNITYTGLCLN